MAGSATGRILEGALVSAAAVAVMFIAMAARDPSSGLRLKAADLAEEFRAAYRNRKWWAHVREQMETELDLIVTEGV